MKHLVLTLCAVSLLPSAALGDTASTEAPAANSGTVAQAAPAASAEKKDEKKDGKAVAATAQPQQQNALANAVQARTPEEQANQSGFQFAFGLDHYLGTGTFVNPQQYASLIGAPSLSATYLFAIKGVKFAASARLFAFYEYSLPDTPNGRRFFMQDSRVSLVAPGLVKEKLTGVAFTPSAVLVLPTSVESFTGGTYFTVGLGGALTRSVKVGKGGFDFRLNLSGGATAARPVVGVLNPYCMQQGGTCGPAQNRDPFGNLLVVGRPDEQFAAGAGMNQLFSGTVGGSVNWRTGGNLLLFAGYSYTRSWGYAATLNPNDQTLPQGNDDQGVQLGRAGMGAGDLTRAFIGASYQLNEHYNIDLYAFTLQSPLVRRGDAWVPRFPIGSIIDAASNNTSIIVSLGAAY
ncbi:MAG: hypothetical protein INH41_20565 [Myxococcaceae bacterium]|nr:hypothetical protein [Myxococcaceae bacterium]MCA3014784.1 hypothetical protein [Myxococcaceae bacterium]